jgi:hypothetical protein
MSFTKAQLFAITQLITNLENLLIDVNGIEKSYHFISCFVIDLNISSSENSTKVIVVFFETIKLLEFNYIVNADGSYELLPIYGV